ncbi:iron-sulfur cluster biosynthesis family protein [Mesobacillus zeae]|uniref:Iron-sulfur cluster biosynthesis family protein n=1 Tax=Mesobacillus zeae TaxID=1917180 RepID=A0A398BJ17_9BACI|nr:iron-sulfur cluster biosynthesis family protein [Mesobacillus zeae]RID87373.1 iron-sulfur cluster biosynthesis family protein [Mesobacillus zeae]
MQESQLRAKLEVCCRKGADKVEITMTEAAMKMMAARTEGKQGIFKLKYDTDDCGCAVNGVAMLWFVDEAEKKDMEAVTNGPRVLVEKAKEIFFDEKMIIDYVEKTGCFQLKSRNQYFNPCMSLVDMTDGQAEE